MPNTAPEPAPESAFTRFYTRLITGWAMGGAILLCGVVVVNVASTLGGIFSAPFAGDLEVTQVGVAVAVFTFLPYAQLTGANVSADIFTARAKPRTVAALKTTGALVALAFALLLLARMSLGMLDQQAYGYTTAILQFPHWIAFIPILASLVLLSLAAILTAGEQLRALRA